MSVTNTVNQSNPTTAELMAMLNALKAENDALKAAKPTGGNGLKVSAKGAVSLYGMGRFPVTFYAEQWDKIFAMQDTIKGFIAENKSSLKVKAPAEAATA